MPHVSFNEDFVETWVPYHTYTQWTLDGTRPFVHAEQWPVDPSLTIDKGAEALSGMEVVGRASMGAIPQSILLRNSENMLVCLRNYRGLVFVNVAAMSKDAITKVINTLKGVLKPPVIVPDERARITVNFTTQKNGNVRIIDAAKWDEIQGNYPSKVRAELAKLVDPNFRPTTSGQLLLWHGLPGTGKTWALRALGWEWRKWVDMVYIVDPEAFFGDSIYMMNTLMSGGGPDYYDDDDDPRREKRDPAKERWRLLVAEDTGELLSADAKLRTGQGLSRLLNIVDGMLGQGFRVMVLITTNEKLGTLHPAVTRPGRCAGAIEFDAFSPEEANEWLRAHNREERKEKKPITLAELFNAQERTPERRVGFAA